MLFLCPDNNKEYPIFGKGGTKALAKEYKCEILAEIPLEMSIREGGDEGKPVSFYQSESLSAKRYANAAVKLWAFLEQVDENGGANNAAIQPTMHTKAGCS